MKLKVKATVATLLAAFCLAFSIHFLTIIFTGSSFGGHSTTSVAGSFNLLERFDNFIVNLTSTALDGIFNVKKVYMLSDGDPVAPEPDAENTSSPAIRKSFSL